MIHDFAAYDDELVNCRRLGRAARPKRQPSAVHCSAVNIEKLTCFAADLGLK